MPLACHLPAPETYPPLCNSPTARPFPEVYSEQAGHRRWSEIGPARASLTPDDGHGGSLLEPADEPQISAAVARVSPSAHPLTANTTTDVSVQVEDAEESGMSANISATLLVPSPPGLIRKLDTLQGVVPLRVGYGGVRSQRPSFDPETALTFTHESPALPDERSIVASLREAPEALVGVEEPPAAVCTASSEKGGDTAGGIALHTPPGSPRSFLQRLPFSGMREDHPSNPGSLNGAAFTASSLPTSMAANTGVGLPQHTTSGQLWPFKKHKEQQAPADLLGRAGNVAVDADAASVAVVADTELLSSTASLKSSSAAEELTTAAVYHPASADTGGHQGVALYSRDTAKRDADQVDEGSSRQSKSQLTHQQVAPAAECSIPLVAPLPLVPFIVPYPREESPEIVSFAESTAGNLQSGFKAAADAGSSLVAASQQSVAVARVLPHIPVLRWGRVPSLPDSAMTPEGSADRGSADPFTACRIISVSNSGTLEDAAPSDSRISDGAALNGATGEAISSDGSYTITCEQGVTCVQATAAPSTQPPVIPEILLENVSENSVISAVLTSTLPERQTMDAASVSAPYSTASLGGKSASTAEVAADRSALALQSEALNCGDPLVEAPPSLSPTELMTSLQISPLRRQAGRSLPLPPTGEAVPPLLSEPAGNSMPISTSALLSRAKTLRRPYSAPAGGRTDGVEGDAAAVSGALPQAGRLSALQRLKFRTAERQAAVLASGPLMQRSR